MLRGRCASSKDGGEVELRETSMPQQPPACHSNPRGHGDGDGGVATDLFSYKKGTRDPTHATASGQTESSRRCHKKGVRTIENDREAPTRGGWCKESTPLGVAPPTQNGRRKLLPLTNANSTLPKAGLEAGLSHAPLTRGRKGLEISIRRHRRGSGTVPPWEGRH